MEALSAGKLIKEEDLVLLGQLPDARYGYEQFHSVLRSFLLSMKNDPVVSLLTVQEFQQQKASPEQLFKSAETEDVCTVYSN